MNNAIRILLAALLAVTLGAVARPAEAQVDVYSTPGEHLVNGRQWRTTCEKYSQTRRCRTEIKATTVVEVRGRFVQTTDWVFNNLTYLPMLTRAQWVGNPLGATGSWTAVDGRKWRTECDTAVTGRGGCRSYLQARVIAATPQGYAWTTVWAFNSMVRFAPDAPVATPQVSIPDAALRACVRSAARLTGSQPLTPAVAGRVADLDCQLDGVKSLAGIQALTNLEYLDLSGNSVTDLAPLSGLKKLSFLSLASNPVTNLGPLSGSTALTYLNVADTRVTSIAVLPTGLLGLDVSHTTLSDLSRVAAMSKLIHLDASHSRLSSLSALQGLTRLEGLDLAATRVTDFAPLARMTGLVSVDVSDTTIASLAPLKGLPYLEGMYAARTRVVDLSPLASLPLLTEVDIEGTAAKDLAPLAGLGEIVFLNLSGTPVTTVKPLAGLAKLRVLVAIDSRVTDWSPLASQVRAGLVIVKKESDWGLVDVP